MGRSNCGALGKERTRCGRMLLVIRAAATCRGAWFPCSYTEELPRDKQARVQELPRWECACGSYGMVRLSLLSSPRAGRFTGVLLCTHIHDWTHNSVPHTLEAEQICQRDGKRKYNHQELNRAKGTANAMQQRECLRAGRSTHVS